MRRRKSGGRCGRSAVLLTLAMAILTGCASTGDVGSRSPSLEHDFLDRDYRRADFRNRFLEERSRCFARGGRMIIDAKQTLGRDGIPNRGDRYFCG